MPGSLASYTIYYTCAYSLSKIQIRIFFFLISRAIRVLQRVIQYTCAYSLSKIQK